MRYLITLLFLCTTVPFALAQDKPDAVADTEEKPMLEESDSLSEDTIPKYQSLFWKIEHPDHDKPSYLYGTMHVSHKIAYHLNDAFYQALKDVDIIALETNPEDWMDKMLEYGNNPYGSYGGGGLYQSFVPKIPEKDDLKAILQMNNQIVNSILYRNNEYQQNFEEETYLDMFIFQAGGKMGKSVVALEDIHEADDLAKKASVNSFDPKREYSPWLKKKLQEKGVVQLTEDAYRDKNLDLIDSLNREYYPQKYNEYMLYERNRNMVVAMDSVMKKGTLLTGIGAAHLPGEDGVIDMLRKEGFTVTPIEGDLTKKGVAIKENFENSFADRTHTKYESADDFLSIELPDKLYELGLGGQNLGLSMDITNGAYFLIFRTSLYQSLSKKPLTLDDIEEMLYENIPGKIKKQERITFQGYPALAINNETKSGEHQRYLIVETPLEFITMKLGGKKDYATQYGSKFFDAIQLKPQQVAANNEISPYYGDFKINMPGTPIINGNSETLSSGGPIEMQSMDTVSGEYYFAQSLVYHDLKYFEEDEFEVEYLHKVWYDAIDTIHTFIKTDMSGIPNTVSSSMTKQGKKVWLTSLKKGPRYYMLGTVGVDSIKAAKYFSSLEFVPYIHKDEKYEERVDTSLYFTVKTPVKAPSFFDYYASEKSETDTIGNMYKAVSYETPYKEFVNVNYRKYHSYYQTENADSIWTNVDKRWIGYDSKDEKIELFDKKIGKSKEGYPTYSFKVKSKGSSRIIHNHYYLNYGLIYLLQYDSDQFNEPSPFIETFINTFSPTDTLVGRSPLKNKTDLFFENIYSIDSLTRAQALSSYNYVDFESKDIPQVMKIIKEFDFTDKELNIKVGILEVLGRMEDPRVFTFLRNLYLNSEYNSIIQLEVISTLAKNPNLDNMKSILSLMKEDIPLSSVSTINNTFAPLRDTAAWNYSKILFPEILEYSSIPEYKSWIYTLAVMLKENKMLKPRIFKKYKKQLVNEMKIEFKRQKTRELNKKSSGYGSYGYGNGNGDSMLEDYISLLMPYYKKTEIKDLFDKINTLDDARIKSILQAQLAKNNHLINQKMIEELTDDPKTRKYVFDSFKRMSQLDKFPKKYMNQKDMAEASLLSDSSYPKIDSTVFIKEILVSEKEDNYVIYFFRTMKNSSAYGYYDEEKEGDWGVQYIAYQVEEDEPIQSGYYAKSTFNEIDPEDTKEIKEFEKTALDKVKYQKRKRVAPYSYYYDY
jgi:uncharacterized protein YbaP (TraB family)